MKNVIILCTGNSCRSQIAHGYLKTFSDQQQINIYSAGIETHGVNPNAIATMQEEEIDISDHTSNHLDEYANITFDFVITVCDNAREVCPIFPGATTTFHHNFKDPAKATGTPTEIQAAFRSTRDEIKQWTNTFYQAYLSQ